MYTVQFRNCSCFTNTTSSAFRKCVCTYCWRFVFWVIRFYF